MTTSSTQQRGGDLEILSEVVMVEIPRGRDGREVLRLRFVKARTPQGKDVAWHDLREFFRADDGQWRPGKKGISIRGAELRPITEALLKATGGAAKATPANGTTGNSAAAPQTTTKPSTPATGGGAVAPFGRSKGTLLSAVDDDDLRWLADALAASVADPAKATWRAKNEKDLAAVREEMRGRFLE